MRLFVAAGVPERHLAWLGDRVAPLESLLPEARWTSAAAQHITLKFLGSTAVELLDAVMSAVAVVAGERTPASVSLSRTGAFPSRRRARVLWMGLDDPSGLLAGLAADLDRAFLPLGYEPEKRAYKPHLTLARFKAPGALPEEADIDASALPPFTVDVLTLWRSRLHPSGARYEVVRSFELKSASGA